MQLLQRDPEIKMWGLSRRLTCIGGGEGGSPPGWWVHCARQPNCGCRTPLFRVPGPGPKGHRARVAIFHFHLGQGGRATDSRRSRTGLDLSLSLSLCLSVCLAVDWHWFLFFLFDATPPLTSPPRLPAAAAALSRPRHIHNTQHPAHANQPIRTHPAAPSYNKLTNSSSDRQHGTTSLPQTCRFHVQFLESPTCDHHPALPSPCRLPPAQHPRGKESEPGLVIGHPLEPLEPLEPLQHSRPRVDVVHPPTARTAVPRPSRAAQPCPCWPDLRHRRCRVSAQPCPDEASAACLVSEDCSAHPLLSN